ncbi:acyltransferase [Micromonospora sp. NPDC049559]|uniref:acyltransferase family protein n=1 Tax=Micromonospora sp. NPDC049559 TaxID=3155923 RepID=UPI003430EB35
MRRPRQLAERTPAGRERYVDLVRAVAIAAVVLGHWLTITIGYDRRGRLSGHSALLDLPETRPVTWLLQVLPVFFLVGGYANAASLAAHRRRGGDGVGWLQDRAARLLRPTTALLVVLAAAALVARLLVGAGPDEVRTVIWLATIPLWFLSAYLLVVALTPVTYALHRRLGWLVPLALVALVAAGDVGRLYGPEWLADGSFLFGWLALHQVGFAWREATAPAPDPPRRRWGWLRPARLPPHPRVAVPLLLVGVPALLLLTLVGPYPVSMVNLPGERIHNMSPPSVALLAVAAGQIGLVLLLRDPGERWLRRRDPWAVVIAVNGVVLTVFLWHITAVVLLVGALDALGVLPTPPVGSAAWWLWRLGWLAALTVPLAGLVAVFGRIELRGWHRPATRPRGLPPALARALTRPAPRALLTAAGYAAVVAGLFGNAVAPKTGDHPVGLPVVSLAGYLAGAALLRLLRSLP